jgi:hypothetical protein
MSTMGWRIGDWPLPIADWRFGNSASPSTGANRELEEPLSLRTNWQSAIQQKGHRARINAVALVLNPIQVELKESLQGYFDPC